MSQNRWLATGNFFTSYREEQRIFLTHLDRMVFIGFLVLVFAWPLFFKVGNKYMLVIDNILIAIVAIYGLNLLTGFAGLISIGHAAFVGVGAYTVASFSRTILLPPTTAQSSSSRCRGGGACGAAGHAVETSVPGDCDAFFSDDIPMDH